MKAGVIQFLEYIFIKVLYLLLNVIPFKMSENIASLLAIILNHIVRYRRRVIINNLKHAFPEYTNNHLTSVMKLVYKNFFILWLEVLQGWRLNKNYIRKNFTMHNWEIVDKARKEGKGIILLTGHIGNFEWIGHCMSILLGDIYAIQKRVKNFYVNDFIVKIRKRHSLKLIYKRDAIKKGLSILKKNKILGIVCDQDAGRKGVFINFFNQPASTAVGPAILHLRTGAPLIVCISIRRSLGKFDYYFERIDNKEIQEVNDQNLIKITQQHTTILEKWIRQYPGQWFWTHRRWKTKPLNK